MCLQSKIRSCRGIVYGSIRIYGDSFLDYKKREKAYIKGLDRDCYILFYGSSTYVDVVSGSIYVDGRRALIKDKKGIYKDKKEWVGLGRVMGGVGISEIGGFWDFGGRIGGVEGSV